MSVTTFTGSLALNRDIISRSSSGSGPGREKHSQSHKAQAQPQVRHNNNNANAAAGGEDAVEKMTTTTGDKLSVSSHSQPLPLTPGGPNVNPPTSTSTSASTSNTSTSTGIGTGTHASEPVVTSSTMTSASALKAYGKIVLTMENVLIPQEKIAETPSLLDDMDPEMEWEVRVVGCELISSAGILLKLPQTAMATGQVLFHRFYYCKSFLRQEMEYTAMACIYLASKIEEAPRRIRDVINVFYHLQQLRNGKTIEPMILDQHYIQTKSDVTLQERRVLKELGFCVHVKHPHKLIVVYMQQLGYDRDSQFVQMSWNYMSDALRSNVFVRYKPEAIACACIFLSARKLKIPLPNNPAWYVVFDVSQEQIMDICETILELYERPRTDYEQFMKKLKALRKTFKENQEKAKAMSVADRITQQSNATSTASPSSRPASPNPGAGAGSGGSAVSSTALQESAGDRDKRRKRDGSEHSGRKSPAIGNSPDAKKARLSRRSPSPIVYDLSPSQSQKHKKKKRRKSRSESSSPSRSRERERRGVKKQSRRSRSKSRSYSPKRSHHKKSKTHHRDRYRSRSRSYSPVDRDERYERERERGYDKFDKQHSYKKSSSSKSSKHPREREEEKFEKFEKSRARDKLRR